MSMQGFGIRLDKDTMDKIKALAEKKRRKPSELIRIVLEDYVKQFENV